MTFKKAFTEQDVLVYLVCMFNKFGQKKKKIFTCTTAWLEYSPTSTYAKIPLKLETDTTLPSKLRHPRILCLLPLE